MYMADCGFGPFEGKNVKANVVAPAFTGDQKSDRRNSVPRWKCRAANKAYWFKSGRERCEFVGGISKFLQERKEKVQL